MVKNHRGFCLKIDKKGKIRVYMRLQSRDR